jgi:uncharacterized protein
VPETVARWQDWEGHGLEHLVLREDEDGGIRVYSFVLGDEEGRPFGLRYQVICNHEWRAMLALVEIAGDGVLITIDDDGNWRKDGDQPLPHLREALDVDITATPFTNTLPIRRLGLEAGQSADIVVAYIDVPSLTVTADPQRYTCLEPMRRYRFESQGGDFVREIEVDEHGLVVLYPGLFRRVL